MTAGNAEPGETAGATPPAAFACQLIREHDRVRLVLEGELDLATAPALEQTISKLREASVERLTIDLSELSFVDSTGLHLILSVACAEQSDAFPVDLVPGPPAVQRVFELTGVIDKLHFSAQAMPSGFDPGAESGADGGDNRGAP